MQAAACVLGPWPGWRPALSTCWLSLWVASTGKAWLPCLRACVLFQGAADVLRQRYPGWTVAPYSEYADKRQQQRAEAAPGRRANGGNKRPRVDAEAAAAASKKAVASAARGGGDDGAEEGKWGRCTIM